MPSRPLPRSLSAPAVAIAAIALLIPASASAKLIPPPGPWPTNVTGATNPLAGTQFAFNGGNASPNAQLRVWLPSGRRHLTAITRTVGQYTTIRGHLRNPDNHHSISGATLIVAVQNVYTPDWTAVTTVRSNRLGDFRAILGPGYHRRAAILYYPTVSSPAPIFSRRLLLRARSRVGLSRPFGKGRAYRFDGQVSAGVAPIPSAGLTIALQVRNRSGHWVSARLARTTASGRFRIRYAFPSATPLTIRVLVPAQTGWALYAGNSRKWAIHPR